LRQPADKAAWARFVKLYTPLLAHWGRKLGLDGQDAEDLVQEVFVVLIRTLPEFRYDRGRRFRGWLWTVILNKHRERTRRAVLPMQEGGEIGLSGVADSEVDPSLDEAEYRQYIVQRAMQIIEEDFQPTTWQAFRECVIASRPPAEVAAELKVSIDVVYASKSRVLRRLRQELDGLLE
jgi:RNA polymerase sigma-70 factor (ECF subfamily)